MRCCSQLVSSGVGRGHTASSLVVKVENAGQRSVVDSISEIIYLGCPASLNGKSLPAKKPASGPGGDPLRVSLVCFSWEPASVPVLPAA